MKVSKLNKQTILKIVYFAIFTFAALTIATFITDSIYIGDSVDRACALAQQKHDQTCVSALTLTVQDSNEDYETRNTAIWALGQLGDKQALAVLNEYYQPQNHINKYCDRSSELCQYKLHKAIKLIDSGVNLTAVFWR